MISFEEYFEENENDKNKLNKKIKYYQRKTERLQSNWNSLKEWITKENNNYHYGLRSGKTLLYGKFLGRVDVLDKMNELESSDNK